MTLTAWLLAHHAISLLVAFIFASSVLSQRRPTGSAFAWLLIIFVAPYIGIPLYLSFGGRKLGAARARQGAARAARGSRRMRRPCSGSTMASSPTRRFSSRSRVRKRSIRILTFVFRR